jgi:hypothetical protein
VVATLVLFGLTRGVGAETISAQRYQRARRTAVKQTGMPLATFPEECPYPQESTGSDPVIRMGSSQKIDV